MSRFAKTYLLFCLLAISQTSFAQRVSFQCAKDTTLSGCAAGCFTLQSKIPDLKGSTSNYAINPMSASGSCFVPYLAPNDAAGQPTSITTDDFFSDKIDIGFPFNFYGTEYTQLVVSTNGVISFDLTNAKKGAKYTVSADLPSTTYEKAVVMGPMHDLDPSKISFSPDLLIQYQVWGTAPQRRWVLSFYKVPLYSSTATCNSLIQNTHQIVLYESSGIVEVLVFDKEVCTNWNSGKSMIGMQDLSRTNGIMAPGRRASDPPWGSIGMNESWRFTPSAGSSLFKRVELYTTTGTLVSTGTATADGAGSMNVSFPNVCPTTNLSTYIIKSVYEKLNDPTTEIAGYDTVRVHRNSLAVSYTSTPPTCSVLGTVTVNVAPGTGTAPIVYSMDGGPFQPGNVFTNVLSGNHNIVVSDAGGCQQILQDVLVASATTIQVTPISTAASCPGIDNGTVKLVPTNGVGPYQYKLTTASGWQSSNTFSNLAAGQYSFFVMDNAGCLSDIIPATVQPGLVITATPLVTNVSCFGGANGSVSLSLSPNAMPPFVFSSDQFATIQASNTFSNLTNTSYHLSYRDNVGCTGFTDVVIGAPAQLVTLAPVLQNALCNGAANGLITVSALGGTSPYQYALDNGAFGASGTFSVSAGTHAVRVKDVNGCSVNVPNLVVGQPSSLTGALPLTTNATCEGGANGTITLNASGGTAGYQYALDGVNFQASGVFSVTPGPYTLTIKDANGCTMTQSATVGLTNNLQYTPLADKAICEGTSTALAPTTNATSFTWQGPAFPAGTADHSSITVSPTVDSSRYTLRAALGLCATNDTVFVRVNAAPVPNAGPDNEICFGKSDTLHASGGSVFEWTPATYLAGNNGIASIGIADPVVLKPEKSTTYTLSVLDAIGCRSLVTDNVTITVTPPIVVNISPVDTVGFIGDEVQLVAFSAATDYAWTLSDGSFAAGLSNPNIKNPVLTFTKDETYRVIASTAGGCAGVGTVSVKAYRGPDIYVPDAFTPNGDGKNDWLRPFPVGVKELHYFRVFDRWGHLSYEYKGEKRGPVVFNMVNTTIGWDGKINGKELTTGVYVWIAEGVTKDGKVIRRQGVVTLIR
jgi:gliding motility-associated-like protein